MIVEDIERKVISNTSNEHAYSIEANAKMFEILSSKIYTYKIAAVVRELCTNAYDSHVEAGKANVPFHVILPNSIHPYFEVEDFGMGLSETQVYEIFTHYGRSTKTESNDFVGALGLGSKTPFAYTTSFTIQTRQSGMEYLFNAYFGDKNDPKVSLLRKRETLESNGVKIKIPVNFLDEDEFINDCAFILSFFRTRPVVKGNDTFEFDFTSEEVAPLYNDELVNLDMKRVRSSLYRNNRLFAVMGTVCYPVDIHDIYSENEDKQSDEFKAFEFITKVEMKRFSNSCFLNFDVGTLDFSASREKLSFDKTNKSKLALRENFTVKGLEKRRKFEEKLNACKTSVEAILLIKEEYGSIEMYEKIFEWKGIPIENLTRRKFFHKTPHIGVLFSQIPSIPIKRNAVIRLKDLIENGYNVVYCKKVKTGFSKYTRMLARQNNNQYLICVSGKGRSNNIAKRIEQLVGFPPENVYVLDDIRKEELEKQKLNTPFTQNKSKPKLPKKEPVEIYACGAQITEDGYWWKPAQRINVEEYIENGYKIYYTDSSIRRSNTDILVKGLKSPLRINVNINHHELYEILGKSIILSRNKRNEKDITKNKLKCIDDTITRYIKNHFDKTVKIYHLCNIFRINDGKLVYENNYLKLMVEANSIHIPEEYETNLKEAKKYKKYISKRIDFSALLVDKKIKSKVYDESLKMKRDIKNILQNNYPLLELAGIVFNQDKNLIDYIKMCDRLYQIDNGSE